MALEVGQIVEGKVSGITGFGAFVDFPDGETGLVHISEVARNYVKDINEHLTVGQTVKVKVLSLDEKGKISLSIKKAQENNFQRRGAVPFSGKPAEIDWNVENDQKDLSFEDMMANFKQSSDARMLDIKRNVESKRGSRRR
ncbi:MAG: S1 RNA-binding domain-containing protein [Ruminococcaceae bacterium]|nr:S1 RNA-binding domain-containing protein [Oscillospiraceae bacterium]